MQKKDSPFITLTMILLLGVWVFVTVREKPVVNKPPASVLTNTAVTGTFVPFTGAPPLPSLLTNEGATFVLVTPTNRARFVDKKFNINSEATFGVCGLQGGDLIVEVLPPFPFRVEKIGGEGKELVVVVTGDNSSSVFSLDLGWQPSAQMVMSAP